MFNSLYNPFKRKSIASLTTGLLGIALILSACGGGSPSEVPTPIAGAAVVDTPTLPAVEIEATATSTEAAVMTDTEAMTDTDAMTETDEMTDTEAMTDTDAITDTETVTETETVTDTDEITDTDPMTDTETVTETDTDDMSDTDTAQITDEAALRASTLIGYPVHNRQDENLGEIEDLMIGLDSGEVKYAVLSFEGFLGIGDKLFAVPLNAMEVDQEAEVVIFNVDEALLENAPGFDPNNYPDTANPEWDLEFRDTFADQQNELNSDRDEFVAESSIRATELMGYNVHNFEDEDLGEIEDLLVGVESSEVRYAVLTFGGFLDIGDKLFAVPLEALTLDVEDEDLILDADQEQLEDAPGFDEDQWPDTADPQWDTSYRDFWDNVG